MKKKHYSYFIIIAVLACGISFYAGTKYENELGNFNKNQQNGAMRRTGQMPGAKGGNNMIAGEIMAMDDKSITVKLRDGGSKIVFLSDKTTYAKMTDTTKSDLKVGMQVSANGTSDSTGIFTAQAIQERPAGIPGAMPNYVGK